MTLSVGDIGKRYTITDIDTNDEELDEFLFTLGCYTGQSIVVVAAVSGSYVVAIRDGRYNIDQNLAEAILVA